jgi:hypothetical protein
MLAGAGVTVTDATGTNTTVTADEPDLPSLVAVIVADPGATPETRPLLFTLATVGALLDHVTTRPVSGLPLPSFGVAVNCRAPPAHTLALAGVTATDATGTKVAVVAADPLFPSLVAVIVAEPAEAPVTRPLPLTVATAGALLAQVTTRPGRGVPAPSIGVAVSCTLPPTEMPGEEGVTATVATGTSETVMTAVPLFPSLVAVIVAEPAALPVTEPVALTLAMAGAFVDHDTVLPVNGLPVLSLRAATSCTPPETTTVAVGGVRLTNATGATVTLMAADPLLPSLVALIVAGPVARPVTRPVLFTTATVGASLVHVTRRPPSGFPTLSRGVAVS